MARFYNTNVTASVCGRPVRISHSTSYPTIQVSSAPAGARPPLHPEPPNGQPVPFQCGSSKVVYMGNIPSSSFSDESILKLAEPFGKVCKYFTNRIKREVWERLEPKQSLQTPHLNTFPTEEAFLFVFRRSLKWRTPRMPRRWASTAKRSL